MGTQVVHKTASIFAGLSLVACLVALQASAQRVPGSNRGPSVAPSFIVGNEQDYAGLDRCRSCHKPEYREYEKTAHSKVAVPSKNFISGCEVCHGPGKAHADAIEAAEGDEGKTQRALSEHPIFSFSVNEKITAALKQFPIFHFRSNSKENAARCLFCHISSKQQEFFEHSAHVAHGMSCDQCHTSHLVKEVKDESKGPLYSPQAHFYQVPEIPDEVRWLHSSLLKESEPKLCYACHGNVQAEFALPVHHRVPEGLVKCTDCHTPHGSLNRVSLTRPNFQSCLNCHQEKRGPYVYEHASVKVLGCATCHNPHGSTNRMLLVRREGRQLCLQCHINNPTKVSVPHGRLGFQTAGECTRCHAAIHGSNLDEFFLR
jgi:predicted CXXCH cytochrome family protein